MAGMTSMEAAMNAANAYMNSNPTTSNVAGSDQYEAIGVVSDYLKQFLPEAYRKESYYQIIQRHGADGLNAIKEAWETALTYANARGALMTADGEMLKKAIVDIALLSSGSGSYSNQIQNYMVGFDKYKASKLPAHLELSGPTFITRPRLCLQSSNLRSNEVMLPLDTVNPSSMAFAIRALLDTNLGKCESSKQAIYQTAINNCPLINPQSPWLTPLCNSLTSITGFADMQLGTDTTDGGYFGEAQQFATGHDNFNRASYSLNCTFREIPGGVIFAILFYWLEYIRCVTRGIMLAYADDIDGLIMNYTVSIYQFNMDPSYQYITRWCKCTGCFPTNLDLGSIFNKSENQLFQDAAQKITTTFVCNKLEYMRPSALMDFNTLAMRYCPNINKKTSGEYLSRDDDTGELKREATGTGYKTPEMLCPDIPYSPFSNFCGLPFIVSTPRGYKLVYRKSEKDMFNDPMIQKLIACDVMSKQHEWSMTDDEATNRYKLYMKYNYEQFYDTHVEAMKREYPNLDFDKIVNDIFNLKYKK